MNMIPRQAPEARKETRVETAPLARVTENDEGYTLALELPGVDERDTELTIEHRTLTVTAENTVARHKDYALTLTEIPEVRYRATFELPERVDTAGIKAAQRNGLLVLSLPKREEVKPRRIAITSA